MEIFSKNMFDRNSIELKTTEDDYDILSKKKKDLGQPETIKRSNSISFSQNRTGTKALKVNTSDIEKASDINVFKLNTKKLSDKQDNIGRQGIINEENLISRDMVENIIYNKEAQKNKLDSKSSENQKSFSQSVKKSGMDLYQKRVRKVGIVDSVLKYYKKVEDLLTGDNNSTQMDQILTSLRQLRRMLDYDVKESQKEDITRYMEILTFYTEVVMDKCSSYMLAKKPITKTGKSRYEMVSSLFKQSYFLKHTLGIREKNSSDTGNPLFQGTDGVMKVSDLLKQMAIAAPEDYTELTEGAEESVVTFKNGKTTSFKRSGSDINTHISGVRLAKALGVGNNATDYNETLIKKADGSYVGGIAKEINGGNTIGELKSKNITLVFSRESYDQLFRIQILDILTGNKRSADDLKVSCKKMGKADDLVYIESFLGDGEMINFTTATDMNLDSLNFKTIDPKMVDSLKAMNSNDKFINSLNLGEKERSAFKTRLSGLVKRIDTITKQWNDKEKEKDEDDKKNKNRADYEWEYADSLLSKSNPQIFQELAGREWIDSNIKRVFERNQLNCNQLKSGFFNRQALKRDNKPGFGRVFLSKLWHAGATVIGLPSLIIKKVVSTIAGGFAKLTDVGQKDIMRDRIPGKLNADNDTIDTEAIRTRVSTEDEKTQSIIDDTRLLPLAFEEAVPVGEDEPPYISLKIHQPKEGSSQTTYSEEVLNQEMGHAMIEIEYSRLNKETGKMQRYRSRFGFYPKGGFQGPINALSLASNGMVVPGVILNDNDHKYTIGRRFQATNQQINKMILFANDYAQEGGYNYITRSCSTFAVEALNHVGVKTGDMLQKDKVDTHPGVKAVLAIDAVIPLSSPFSLYNNFKNRKKGKRDDLDYQRVGQKMLTQKEYERLFVTHHDEFKGYTPAFLAENIRAFESGDPEDIVMSRDYVYKNGETPKLFSEMVDNITDEKNVFIRFIKNEFKDKVDQKLLDNIDSNLTDLCNKLWDKIPTDRDPAPTLLKSAEYKRKIKESSLAVNQIIQYVSKIFNVTLKRDKSVNIPTHHFISTLELLKEELIQKNSAFRLEMLTSSKSNEMVKATFADVYDVSDLDKSKSDKTGITRVNFMELVALTEVYGDFKTVISKASRYMALKQKENKTDGEKGEFNLLERGINLSKPFQKAHMYYFESSSLSKQMANIAFNSLPSMSGRIEFSKVKSKISDLGVKQRFEEPAQLYQSVAFGKLFSGILPDKSTYVFNKPETYIGEFDKAAARIVEERKEEFEYILEAMYNANNKLSRDEFCNNLEETLINTFLRSELAKEFEAQYLEAKAGELDDKKFGYSVLGSDASMTLLKNLAGTFYDRKHAQI